MLLLTEGLRNSRDLKALWQDEAAPRDSGALLEAAGKALASLHRAGFAHGDCKWSNLQWTGFDFYLVDLEGVEKAALGGRRQARDLARFSVNAEDLEATPDDFEGFLSSYCQGVDIPRETVVDRLMPDLIQLRNRHREKYGERGAPLL
jgi:tRNA A-37 threonylcarbamoyl transferase component Bud32